MTYLRRLFSGALQEAGFTVPFEARRVYDNPTAASLGDYIFQLISGQVSQNESPAVAVRAEEMSSLVATYTKQFPSHEGSSPVPDGEVVLVTGSTGSLGAHVLKALVSLDSIRHVYALNRKGGKEGNCRNVWDNAPALTA